jgi:hypothetical protein
VKIKDRAFHQIMLLRVIALDGVNFEEQIVFLIISDNTLMPV